jgi:UDP-glucose 4-epimerase
MTKPRSVVTGGAGFIGSHLVDLLLEKGHDVTVVDNLSTGRLENLKHVEGRFEFIKADLSRDSGWQQSVASANFVFHLAALADIVPSIQQPEHYFHANVTGTFNLLQALRNSTLTKLVYAASSSCYGIPEKYPTPESAAISPQYPYALTKYIGEELVMHWSKVYKIPTISTRFFNVYGPRSRTSGTYGAVFGVFLAQKLAGKPLTVVGDGNQTRDFTFVSDVVNGIYSCAVSHKNGEIYNIGSGKKVSVNLIAELLQCEKTHIPKRPGEPDSTFADISKIKSEIGWSPKVPIEDGIAELLKNIEYWRNAPVWTPEAAVIEYCI